LTAMVESICRCGGKLSWAKQYNRFYCSNCRRYPPTCPSCGKDLFWVPGYERYYCNNCLKYQEPAVQKSPQASRTYSPERIHEIFSDLKERYKTGGMDEVMFAKLNRALKFRDTDGRVWAIGLETGHWYYYENEKWVEGQPPKTLIP